MSPTLRHDDVLLVSRGAVVRAGDVVTARFVSLPELLVVKRAVEARDGGWWVASENPFVGGDSTVHGEARVEARVLARWRRGQGWPLRRVQ
jgi:phage repressor protein C with HTH and peptisase S24 domain